jgi:hypothetical protein
MLFNAQNYAAIKAACQSKTAIQFTAEKGDTAFAESNAPLDWTAYPPALLPPEGYAQVFVHSDSDARGALTRLELVVHLDGGRILYKANGSDRVDLSVTWASQP